MKSKGRRRPPIARYGMVGVEALNDLLQPSALLRRCVVLSLPQLFLHPPKRCLHSVATGAPLNKEVPCSRLTADKCKAQECEGLRLAKPALFSIGRRKAAKLDQPGLVRMQRKREPLQTFTHIRQEPLGVGFVLKSEDSVVGETHHNHIPSGVTLTPLVHPQVERIMEINVGQQGRCSRTLRDASLTVRPDPFIQHSSLQPFAYQTNHAFIRNPMLQEADQPISAQPVEEASDIDIEDPVHLFPVDSNTQRIQRIVLTALRSEAIRESEEIFLVNPTEHCNCRPLDDFIFQCGDTQRSDLSIRFRNVLPPAGQRPVRSPLDPCMQIYEIAL